MNNYNLNDWLIYLENLHFDEIKLGLDRISNVAKILNVLNFNSTVITVAGTNGKGSTISSLEMIYLAQGYQVGVYSSPHLIKFNERIRVNNKNIADEILCSLFLEIEKARNNIVLSYFEIVTLAAFLYFKKLNLDVILLEVGMGGRLDATNIINPNLSIITTVDFDHQKYLGENLEAIGFEKAGIMRANSTCIYADNNPPDSIVKKAYDLNSKLYILNQCFNYEIYNNILKIITPKNKVLFFTLPSINLNAFSGAIAAVECLEDKLPVKFNEIKNMFQNFVLPGRLQLIRGRINVVFDVAHNVQAVSNLLKFMKNVNSTGHIHAIFAAFKDKDLNGLINLMSPLVQNWFAVELNNKRSCTKEDLTNAFLLLGIKSSVCFNNPLNAFMAALERARIGDLIVIYGSFSLVGPLLEQLTKIKSLINRKINEIEA